MKFTSANITGILILAGITGVATYAKAQESRPFPEPDAPLKETKIEQTSLESEAVPQSKPQRDSVQVILKPTPKATKTPEKSGSKDKQEDPLSFNFLYYIIEKFKLSDIKE
jgi:hypothetical protein